MITIDLTGRVAVVTGAARGLGAAMADMLAAAGAETIRLDVEPGAGVIGCDVTDEASIKKAMAVAASRHGRLDIVIANAGIVPPWRETEALDLAMFQRTLDINVTGVATTLKHAVPHMKARGGAIVATSSIMGARAHGRQSAYVASKHAVLGIVRSAALDLGRYKIRVNAVGPGSVATDALLSRIDARERDGIGPGREAALEAAAREPAIGRMITAEDVARTVLYLSSDLASGVSGQLILVDGALS